MPHPARKPPADRLRRAFLSHSPASLLPRRYAAAACDDADGDYLSEGLQIVGMSATLPNVDQVAK